MVLGETRDPLTELRRGILEYCVLAVIRRNESYAYEIVRVLSDAGSLVTSEGTIYPLLSRLRRDGLVQTTWRESESGPPRRYYRLTGEGQRALGEFVLDWSSFRDAVDRVVAT
jgi:PadR family transcriptional regulator PadR